MGIRRVGWVLLLLLVLSAPVMAGALPERLEEMPIYPGAVRDRDAEEEYLDTTYFTDSVVFHEVQSYKVQAMIDDVVRFYLDQLEPELGWPEEDPYSLFPGESMGPWYEPDFYQPYIFEDQYEYDTLIQDGKWIRKAFAERPQWQQGKWLSQVWIGWVFVNEDGDRITHSVLIEDEGYDWKARVDYKSTWIRFETTVTEGNMMWDDDWDDDWSWDDDDWDDDWDNDWDDDWGWGMGEVSLEPPTEEYLGIPFYPGMVFNLEVSEAMSLEDYHYYVFFSPDSVEQVTDFYEERLGKEPLFTEEGYLFALRGRFPIPDDGLAIQPNEMFVGFPQTVIAVQKQMRE